MAPSGDTVQQPRLEPEQVQELVRLILRLSWPWTLAMVVVAIATAVDVVRPADGGVTVHFGVGTASLVALALVWLPALISLVATTGGSVKGFGVEASTTGVANAEGLVTRLAAIRATTVEVERTSPAAAEQAESVRRQVDSIAAEYLRGTDSATPGAFADLARRYEQIRATQQRGSQRTIAMNLLMNEARVRAASAPEAAGREAPRLLRSTQDGDRVIGLALAQQDPEPSMLPEILRMVATSRSAFEQYHALLALQALAPSLGDGQRAEAVDVLRRERDDPRGVGLQADPYIPGLIDSLLARLDGVAAG